MAARPLCRCAHWSRSNVVARRRRRFRRGRCQLRRGWPVLFRLRARGRRPGRGRRQGHRGAEGSRRAGDAHTHHGRLQDSRLRQGHQSRRGRDHLRQGRLCPGQRAAPAARPQRHQGSGRGRVLPQTQVKHLLFTAAVIALACCQASPGHAQALIGSVTSAEEGAMEGVLVSAQAAGSPITATVVSDEHGQFRFPDGRLASGHYALRIRAIGYELDGPRAVDLGAAATEVAITLRETSDLAAQLTNTEWFMSMPGTPEEKRPLIECMSCHTFERIVRSTYDAEAFFPVLKRMAQYANNTTQARVQSRLAERDVHDDLVRKLAAYLATVNLSRGPTWPYALQTLPRPKGRATHVVITEYDLPRQTIATPDVRTDAQGHVWYSNFVENFLGELDPKTGAHREYAIPVQKSGSPTGALDLEADD